MGLVKLTSTCYVPYENIACTLGYEMNATRIKAKALRKEGLLMDATRGKKARSLIILKEGPFKGVLVDTAIVTVAKKTEAKDVSM